jgi:hypothetical protein
MHCFSLFSLVASDLIQFKFTNSQIDMIMNEEIIYNTVNRQYKYIYMQEKYNGYTY